MPDAHDDDQPPLPAPSEPTVDELLRRARPLPPRKDMVIDDLDDEEGEAFLAAIRRSPV